MPPWTCGLWTCPWTGLAVDPTYWKVGIMEATRMFTISTGLMTTNTDWSNGFDTPISGHFAKEHDPIKCFDPLVRLHSTCTTIILHYIIHAYLRRDRSEWADRSQHLRRALATRPSRARHSSGHQQMGSLFDAKYGSGNFELSQVADADLAKQELYSPWLAGASALAITTTSTDYSQTDPEMVVPVAVEQMQAALATAARVSTVKSVAYLSSGWEAWRWVSQHIPRFNFNTLLVDVVFGRIVSFKDQGALTAVSLLTMLYDSEGLDYVRQLVAPQWFVSIRDVSRLFVKLLSNGGVPHHQ
ncbi:hypothetical protein FIBSPDRAFT_1048063 [Athelia psychrophila]|uniref:Uncharacterized protein n=1 Tax=Athelia psychrophila TaxID=1759441 RepID=A0A166EA50_9AGAM|nr:hypothetical protein FIBSPDRAFT_1048063 [Fibularhizoctonia sp. CBS 109695]